MPIFSWLWNTAIFFFTNSNAPYPNIINSLCVSPMKIHVYRVTTKCISRPFQINDLKWPVDDLWTHICVGDMWTLARVSLYPSAIKIPQQYIDLQTFDV